MSNSTFGSLSSLFDNHDRENHVRTPSSSESGASLPSPGGHTSAGKSALKALRQELADLVKIWYQYATVRVGQPDYFKKELWDRKKNWQPMWEKLREE